MKKTKLFLIALLMVGATIIMMTSCTENARVKYYGSEGTIELKEGNRLVNATWKDADLWLLVEHNPSKPAKTYFFYEESSWGLMEGSYKIIEK